MLLVVFAVSAAVTGYLAAVIIGGSYRLQLAEYRYYAEHNLLYMFPFQPSYYLREIVVVNLVYLLARGSWSLLGGPVIASMVLVILV